MSDLQQYLLNLWLTKVVGSSLVKRNDFKYCTLGQLELKQFSIDVHKKISRKVEKMFSWYDCESGIDLLACRVTWNYAFKNLIMFSTHVLVNKKHNSCILSSDPFRFTPKQISICFILCFVFNPGFQLISSKFSIWTMSGSVSNIGISFSSLRPKTDFPQQISRFLLSQTRLFQADSP